MANKFTDYLFVTGVLHWKKAAVATVVGIFGLGYWIGDRSDVPEKAPVATPPTAEQQQAIFNERAKEAFAELGLTLKQATLVFTKTPACRDDQPYGADFAAVNAAGKDINGTICMSQERQGRIIVGS